MEVNDFGDNTFSVFVLKARDALYSCSLRYVLKFSRIQEEVLKK